MRERIYFGMMGMVVVVSWGSLCILSGFRILPVMSTLETQKQAVADLLPSMVIVGAVSGVLIAYFGYNNKLILAISSISGWTLGIILIPFVLIFIGRGRPFGIIDPITFETLTIISGTVIGLLISRVLFARQRKKM